jgi:hypothetical protein
VFSSRYSANELEGRGQVIEGRDLEHLTQLADQFTNSIAPNGERMGRVLYQSQFAATVEELAALVEDCKSSHPELAAVVLDHFHAMGPTPGYGSNTTAELAARATAIKALAGRCELDVFVVAQLNRGAYGNPTGPDVSHLAGTSELERYASAVWLLDRPMAAMALELSSRVPGAVGAELARATAPGPDVVAMLHIEPQTELQGLLELFEPVAIGVAQRGTGAGMDHSTLLPNVHR